MTTLTLNPNIVSILAITGKRRGFDSGQDELVSDTLRFVGNGVDADGLRNNQAQYIEAARKLSDGQTITDQEALLNGAKRAFSNLNPQEFVVTCGGRSLSFNTARFIEFFHGIHVGFSQINELVNEPNLLIYPNHEKFGPLLRASVHNPPADTDSILKEPGFMQAVFKAFGGLERAGDMVELGGLIINLENELAVNKIDWACNQITGELDKQAEAKPEAGEPTCGIVTRFKENLSPIVHNIGHQRAMAFGHQVTEDIEEIGRNSGGTPTTIALERFRKLVSDFHLDSIISFSERSLIKDLYLLLGGDPENNFENSILRDDRLAITDKCRSLNEACSSGISALVLCIDNKTVLDALNNKLGAETDTKKQAQIVKAFIEGDEIPANLKVHEPVRNLLVKLTEIANGTRDTAGSSTGSDSADPSGDRPADPTATTKADDAGSKADPQKQTKQEILILCRVILDSDSEAKLSQIIDATDFTKVEPQYGLAALLAGLEKCKTPIEKSDYLGPYTDYWKGCGALANEAYNALDELHVKMLNLEDIGVEGLRELRTMFTDNTATSEFQSLLTHLGYNTAKKLVSREDVLAVSERLNRATTWQEAKSTIDDFCTEHLGKEFTQLNPVKKHFVMYMFYDQAVGSTKILEALANGLKPKAEAQKAKATDSKASEEGKKGGSWWSNIPIIGFIGSLIASGIGLIWAFKAENKKPPIILTLIGAIGAVITGLINWVFNKGGKEDSQADNQSNQPKTQTARREETAEPEVA